MKSIILAAGRGSRLHPLTVNSPKCLTELGGISIIQRQIETLRHFNVDDITIITGYLDDALSFPGVRTIHNEKWQETNMVESLFCAEASFGTDLIISYGDIVYEGRVLEALIGSSQDISVVVDQEWRPYWSRRFANPLDDAESLRTDTQGRITDIGNPVTNIDEIEAQYIGLMRFKEAGINFLSKTKHRLGTIQRPWMESRPLEKAYMTDLLMELILTGHAVHSVPVRGGWIEIDTIEDLTLANELISKGSVSFLPNLDSAC